MIAPSGMMDGIIQTLREALDGAGYENLPIMSYSTKFASGTTDRFVMWQNPLRHLAIERHTRWTLQTEERRLRRV